MPWLIQTILPSTITVSIAGIYLRRKPNEWKKMQTEEIGKIAVNMLENGEISPMEFLKFRNTTQIAKKADKIYMKNKQINKINSKQPSADWFINFLEGAGNVSDGQMQELWAKVLAGEIATPGSFSLRTLSTLKTLSKSEAETIQTVVACAMPINRGYYIYLDEALQSHYNNRMKLVEMYDCGIIENNIASSYSFSCYSASLFMQIGSLICYTNNNEKVDYSIEMQRFTVTGSEFIRLVSPNENYSIDFLTD